MKVTIESKISTLTIENTNAKLLAEDATKIISFLEKDLAKAEAAKAEPKPKKAKVKAKRKRRTKAEIEAAKANEQAAA